MGTRPRFIEAGATREGTLSFGAGLVGGGMRAWTPDDLQIAGLCRCRPWTGWEVRMSPPCRRSWKSPPLTVPSSIRASWAWRGARWSLLARRRGPPDGRVLRSGEAIADCARAAMEDMRAGLALACTIAGPLSAAPRGLLGTNLVDWVGIDVAATPGTMRLWPAAAARASGRGVVATSWPTPE